MFGREKTADEDQGRKTLNTAITVIVVIVIVLLLALQVGAVRTRGRVGAA